MSVYDYWNSKQRVINILTSKTEIKATKTIPSNENEFTYENGIKTMVGALFVDIRESTKYFKENKSEIVSRVMRAFCSEVIAILKTDENYRQIGIRGDCVYGIFSTPSNKDVENILRNAAMINSFQNMLQSILIKNHMPTFQIGIGLGCSEELVIKAGSKGTGINDLIWIGDAVIDACKLSSEGNTCKFFPIVMDKCFYNKIKNMAVRDGGTCAQHCREIYSEKIGTDVWDCKLVNVKFDDYWRRR